MLRVAIAIQAIGGLAAGPLNPILGALEYERIPADMRGRVFGALTAAAYIAMPLGALVAGPLLAGLGLRGTLLTAGGCYLTATLSMLLTRHCAKWTLSERLWPRELALPSDRTYRTSRTSRV